MIEAVYQGSTPSPALPSRGRESQDSNGGLVARGCITFRPLDGPPPAVPRTTDNTPPPRKTAPATAILPPLEAAVTMPHRFPQLVAA